MKKLIISVVGVAILLLSGAVVGAEELEGNFEDAICKHFKVKQSNIEAVRSYGIGDEDLPVVFHVAKRAKIDPERVASMRSRGDSWADLVKGRNMNLEIFYIPVSGQIDSYTYAPIIDQYRSVPEKQWNQMPLSDADVVNMVNLKLVSSGFDYNIFEVMKLRDDGKGFVQICHEIKEAKDLLIAQQRTERRTANAGMF